MVTESPTYRALSQEEFLARASADRSFEGVLFSSDLAWDFIDVVLSPGPQACFGNIIQYGMSNTKVTYSPKVAPRITSMSEIVWPPFSEVPSRLADWVERWNKQIGG